MRGEEKLVISFPRMGNYHIPAERALTRLFPGADKILPPPPITRKTLEIGARYSPEGVCAPFKYNVGNFIEALDAGANVLVQTGRGCIFGYYGELQEQILRDLGYKFDFLCFSRGKIATDRAVRVYRALGGTRSVKEIIATAVFAFECARMMDGFEYRMRERIGFERVPGSFESLHGEFLRAVSRATGVAALPAIRARYSRAMRGIALDMPREVLRVGLVGELFTLMEPFSNFYLERELAKAGVSVSRRMGAAFLLTPRGSRSVRKSGDYLRRSVGANGADSVAQTLGYGARGFDGVIHMKSFGCAPEINAMPALINISREKNIPVLHLSFDTHTGEEGIRTRLEAFVDMIKMRRAADCDHSRR